MAQYGNIVAIGVLDVRHLNQPGKIVVETPAAAPSSLVALGSAAAAGRAILGQVATRVIAIGDRALTAAALAAATNIAVGVDANAGLTTGPQNIRVGHNVSANAPLTTGQNNVEIGHYDSTGVAGSTLAAVPAAASSGYLVLAGGTTVAVADPALRSVHLGSQNPGRWRSASGADNVSIGDSAAAALTTGARNVAIGTEALAATTTRPDLVAVGYRAARLSPDLSASVVIGSGAYGLNTDSPGGSVVIGYLAAGGGVGTSSFSTIVGYRAGYALTSAQNNALFGPQAGQAITIGSNNLALGYNAASNLVGGANNTLVGFAVAPTLVSGNGNVVVGSFEAGGGSNVPAAASQYIAISGHFGGGPAPTLVVADPTLRNLHFGPRKPGNWLTASGADNLALGDQALDALTSGARNLAQGSDALGTLTTGTDNVAVGHNALLGAAGSEAALRNVVIGSFALDAVNAAVTDSTAVGYNAATAVTSGIGGVYVGSGAGAAVTTGKHNTLLGFGVAPALTTGQNNVVIGAFEDTATMANLPAAATGHIVIAAEADGEGAPHQTILIINDLDVFIGGNKPGNWLTSAAGGQNTSVGGSSLRSLTTGIRNTTMGWGAGTAITIGAGNIFIGYSAGDLNISGSTNICIGFDADVPTNATSNHLNLGGVLFGDLAGLDVRIGGGNVAVAQTERLAVTDGNADTVAPFSVETTGANGAKCFVYVGTQDPSGVVAALGGSLYLRVNGASSSLFQNKTAGTGTTWSEIGGVPTTSNKAMAASVTAADFALACATAITSTPIGNGYVSVLINGAQVELGDGVRTKDCYFSVDGGATARAISAITAGDSLYWVGSVAGYELAATDKVDFNYNV